MCKVKVKYCTSVRVFTNREQEIKNVLNVFAFYSLCFMLSGLHHAVSRFQVKRAPCKGNFTSGLNLSHVYYVVDATSKRAVCNLLGPQISK